MVLCKVLEGKWACPWIILERVEEIRECLHGKKHRFQHIVKEGNQLADYFINIAIENGNCTFTKFNSMEAKGRRILNNDI